MSHSLRAQHVRSLTRTLTLCRSPMTILVEHGLFASAFFESTWTRANTHWEEQTEVEVHPSGHVEAP